MRPFRLPAIVVAALAIGCGAAFAEIPSAGPARLPLAHDPGRTFGLDRGHVLVVEGRIEGTEPVTLVLRIDDDRSTDYGSRANIERTTAPGPFRWDIPVTGLRSTDGRALRTDALRRIILFRTGLSPVTAQLRAEPARGLPGGASGFSFGPVDAPLLPGFERVAPGDPRLAGERMRAIRRPGVDPLTASGIDGVRTVRLAVPGGPLRVTLWTEDPGEWELLPHPLRRRIVVAGRVVRDETLSPEEWLTRRYLAGRDREWRPGDDAWTLYGVHRGGRVTVEVEPRPGEGLLIELSGEGPGARHLSAVLVEPASLNGAALAEVEARRAEWHRAAWTIRPEEEGPPIPVFALDGEDPTEPLRFVGAAGGPAFAAFALTSRKERRVSASIAWSGRPLPASLHAAQVRLERRDVGRNVLVPAEEILRADVSVLPVRTDRPRRYDMVVHVPPDAEPGLRRGEIVFVARGIRRTIPFEAEILPVRLPPTPAPVGFYLDEPPHLAWFGGDREARARRLACDLAVLRRFGLTGNAPAFSTPSPQDRSAFLADARIAAEQGTAGPWLAYAPFKRAVAAQGLAGAAALAATLDRESEAAGLPKTVWSIADEPSNHDGAKGPKPVEIAAAMRAAAPRALLGAQLNNPGDVRHAGVLDVAIVNPGFGIDPARIEALRALGPRVWLYNAGRPRLAAGYWTKLVGAERYLQWHARMPTADPFDPTDGREGDVQIFMPSTEPCAGTGDLHRDLFRLAEGVLDRRWMEWLDGRPEPEAAALRTELVSRFGKIWTAAAKIPDAELDRFRRDAAALARRLNLPPGQGPEGR